MNMTFEEFGKELDNELIYLRSKINELENDNNKKKKLIEEIAKLLENYNNLY